MPEERLFETEGPEARSEIAQTLVSAAEQIKTGTVRLESTEQDQTVTIPEEPTFEVELERLTDSETGNSGTNSSTNSPGPSELPFHEASFQSESRPLRRIVGPDQSSPETVIYPGYADCRIRTEQPSKPGSRPLPFTGWTSRSSEIALIGPGRWRAKSQTVGSYEEVRCRLTAVRVGDGIVVFDGGLTLSKVLVHENIDVERMCSLD